MTQFRASHSTNQHHHVGLAAVMAYYFLSGFIWGAGYAPTSRKEIEKVARFLDLKAGKTFYDSWEADTAE